jgi:hypothetical protein
MCPLPVTIHPEDGGSMASETLVSYHITTRRHNTADRYFNFLLSKQMAGLLQYVAEIRKS